MIPRIFHSIMSALITQLDNNNDQIQSNFLYKIKPDILLLIFTKYLDVIDMARLEIAYCSSSYRAFFLTFLNYSNGNHFSRFQVPLTRPSQFPHMQFSQFDNYIKWKELRNVKTQGVLSMVHCEASSSYSRGESVQEIIYKPYHESHWHTTQSTAYIIGYPHQSPIQLEVIRFIRDRDGGGESGTGIYNGRNPATVEITIKDENDEDRKIEETPVPWIDDEHQIALLCIPQSIPHNQSMFVTSIRLDLKNRYPNCNTPPGHRYDYNGNKLSLHGLEFLGKDI